MSTIDDTGGVGYSRHMSPESGNSPAERAVEIAYNYLGLPYVFAGGDLDGPTNGGFDRAGLTRHIVYATTGTDIGRTLDAQLDHCARLPAGRSPSPETYCSGPPREAFSRSADKRSTPG